MRGHTSAGQTASPHILLDTVLRLQCNAICRHHQDISYIIQAMTQHKALINIENWNFHKLWTTKIKLCLRDKKNDKKCRCRRTMIPGVPYMYEYCQYYHAVMLRCPCLQQYPQLCYRYLCTYNTFRGFIYHFIPASVYIYNII